MQSISETDVENGSDGRRDSDIKPKRRSELQRREKGLTRGVYMDEALAKTNFGLFNYTMIILCGMISTTVFVETCNVAYIIPVSECDLNLSSGEKGILSAVSFLGIILSSHLWGYLADTKGRRCVIMPTLLVAFLLSCASSLVQNFYLFVSLRFLNGFFLSGSSATIFVYLSEFFDSKHRSRAIMGSSMIYGTSLVLVPLVAWSVINQDWQFDIPIINITYKPWRLFLVVCSFPGFISFIILLFLPESPKFVHSQGDKAQAYAILQKMYRINNGRSSELEKFDIIEEPEAIANRKRILNCKESRFPLLNSIWLQTAPLFKRTHLFSTILICTVQFGIYSTSNGFYIFAVEVLNKMASNLNSFVDQRMPMCETIHMKSANLSTVSNDVCITKLEMSTIQQEIVLECIFAIGSIFVSLLVNKLGKFPIMFSILIVCGSSGIMCMLTDVPILQICAFLTLLSCGLATTIVNAATVELYPVNSRAMALCISLMFGRLGCVFGANTAALLLEHHCETVFLVSGTTVLVIGLLTFFIPNIHKRSESKFMVVPNESRLSVISARYIG